MAGQLRPGYQGLLSPFLKDILRWHKKGATTTEIARRINERDASVKIGSRHVYYVLRRMDVLVLQPTGPLPAPEPRAMAGWTYEESDNASIHRVRWRPPPADLHSGVGRTPQKQG
jgi:hypothetical protein